MRRGVNFRELELIKRFRSWELYPPQSANAFYLLLVVAVLWFAHDIGNLVIGKSGEPAINPELWPYVIAGILFVVFLGFLFSPIQVLIFREGIYAGPGPLMKQTAPKGVKREGFIPWGKLRLIIRTPYPGIGMILGGENPKDEIYLSNKFRKHFDELQRLIIEMKQPGTVRVIDLMSPEDELHKFIRGGWMESFIRIAFVNPPPYLLLFLLLPVLLGGLKYGLLFVIAVGFFLPLLIWAFIVCRLGYRADFVNIYDDGVIVKSPKKFHFLKWEEIASISMLGNGRYSIKQSEPESSPVRLKISSDSVEEFEKIIQRKTGLTDAVGQPLPS